jgi:hypothetical protein
MTNSLLMLIKLDIDTIAFLSLIVSIVGVIVGLVSATAAIFAAFYSKRATTKGDRARAEQNTQHVEQVSKKASSTDTRMHQQEEREALQAQAQRVSISVEGEAVGDVPVELLLTLQDPSVRVSRVERLGEAGSSLGSSPCKATDNALVFKCIVAQEKVRQWRDEGESTSDGGTRSVLRVYMLLNESRKEVCRDMPASIVEDVRNVGIATLSIWNIKGSI